MCPKDTCSVEFSDWNHSQTSCAWQTGVSDVEYAVDALGGSYLEFDNILVQSTVYIESKTNVLIFCFGVMDLVMFKLILLHLYTLNHFKVVKWQKQNI